MRRGCPPRGMGRSHEKEGGDSLAAHFVELDGVAEGGQPLGMIAGEAVGVEAIK